MVLVETLESPLDFKEIQPVHPKGNQPWIFIGRIDAEAEVPILWPPDAKNWLIGKDPDAGKDWRQEEKGMTEDEMVQSYHQLDGHEFEQALGVGDGQGSLECCSPWDCIESDWVTELNWFTMIYNVCFRYTAKWFSYMYTYVYSFSGSFLIRVITEYWADFPVLYSRSLLVIYLIYRSMYMLMPSSLFLSPHISLLVTVSLCSISVSLCMNLFRSHKIILG